MKDFTTGLTPSQGNIINSAKEIQSLNQNGPAPTCAPNNALWDFIVLNLENFQIFTNANGASRHDQALFTPDSIPQQDNSIEYYRSKISTDKADTLKKAALSCLENDNNRELLFKLGLSEKLITQAYVDYDYDIFAFDNTIYDSLAIRMVMHLHNSLPGSWHIGRQNTIYQFIQHEQPNSVMDIGFGIPSLYVRNALRESSMKITLSDFSDSAAEFASNLLEIWNKDWYKNVTLSVEDMTITALHPPKHDIYIFQDSLEHVPDPATCLKNFIQNTHPEAKFIFSLPIGPKIPVHSISWDTEQAILDWLTEAGLQIQYERLVKVNPAVDLFAEQVDYSFINVIALCTKNNSLHLLEENNYF
jgi:hypothetical protein